MLNLGLFLVEIVHITIMTDIRQPILHFTMERSRIKAGSPVTGLSQDQEQEGHQGPGEYHQHEARSREWTAAQRAAREYEGGFLREGWQRRWEPSNPVRYNREVSTKRSDSSYRELEAWAARYSHSLPRRRHREAELRGTSHVLLESSRAPERRSGTDPQVAVLQQVRQSAGIRESGAWDRGGRQQTPTYYPPQAPAPDTSLDSKEKAAYHRRMFSQPPGYIAPPPYNSPHKSSPVIHHCDTGYGQEGKQQHYWSQPTLRQQDACVDVQDKRRVGKEDFKKTDVNEICAELEGLGHRGPGPDAVQSTHMQLLKANSEEVESDDSYNLGECAPVHPINVKVRRLDIQEDTQSEDSKGLLVIDTSCVVVKMELIPSPKKDHVHYLGSTRHAEDSPLDGQPSTSTESNAQLNQDVLPNPLQINDRAEIELESDSEEKKEPDGGGDTSVSSSSISGRETLQGRAERILGIPLHDCITEEQQDATSLLDSCVEKCDEEVEPSPATNDIHGATEQLLQDTKDEERSQDNLEMDHMEDTLHLKGSDEEEDQVQNEDGKHFAGLQEKVSDMSEERDTESQLEIVIKKSQEAEMAEDSLFEQTHEDAISSAPCIYQIFSKPHSP
ncbi:unnamed protein product [Pleuronectes platessa]|uniref:Uncharacterized protein n=1 Tax=Pleuronectes platessa TaxID=8262 RepID=A0A9N7Y8H5_PLEPL|nr:unnamed protein product [Pleuronectes platessa]